VGGKVSGKLGNGRVRRRRESKRLSAFKRPRLDRWLYDLDIDMWVVGHEAD